MNLPSLTVKRVDAVIDGRLVKVVPAADYDDAMVMLEIMTSLAENSSGLTGDAEEAIREARSLCSTNSGEVAK